MKIFPVYYFPPVSWFAALSAETEVVLEQWIHFRKQQYTTRCYIRGANKVQLLSLPIVRDGEQVPLCKKQVSYEQGWQKDHWRGIESAYRSAPYFEYYEHEFAGFFREKHDTLLGFHLHVLPFLLRWLNLEVRYTLSDKFTGPEFWSGDLRDAFDPSGKPPAWFRCEPYTQVFGEDFVPDLSILDLLFNLGPESGAYLRRAVNQEQFLHSLAHRS